mgnify:CR=1 FL=1
MLFRSARFATLVTSLFALRFFSVNTKGFTTGPILCLFRLLSGKPCPFCGTTRAIGALCEGKFYESILLNPMGILLVISMVFIFLFPPGVQNLIERISRHWWVISERNRWLVTLLILSSLWLFDLPRLT